MTEFFLPVAFSDKDMSKTSAPASFTPLPVSNPFDPNLDPALPSGMFQQNSNVPVTQQYNSPALSSMPQPISNATVPQQYNSRVLGSVPQPISNVRVPQRYGNPASLAVEGGLSIPCKNCSVMGYQCDLAFPCSNCRNSGIVDCPNGIGKVANSILSNFEKSYRLSMHFWYAKISKRLDVIASHQDVIASHQDALTKKLVAIDKRLDMMDTQQEDKQEVTTQLPTSE